MRFGFGGAEHEIDLSKKNAAAFREKITPFLEHARKAGRRPARGAARAAASRQRSGDIRAWATDRAIVVSGRARIPASVAAQYHAAANRH